jgi:hypothetical protein
MARSEEPSDSEIKEELRRKLLPAISERELGAEITDVLNLLGRKPGTREEVGAALARKFIAKFARPNRKIEELIEYRPRQLHSLLHEIVWEQCQHFIRTHPEEIRSVKKSRAKVASEAERIHRRKASKNWYERRRRRPLKPGLIEQQFGENSPLSLAGLLQQLPPTGPCLDGIFHGGTVRMCDGTYSLQSLFGLTRKKLSAAAPAIRRGRKLFYDYRAVLRCMEGLLKHTGEDAAWLSDLSRRRTVLTGVLFRAKQEARPKIADAFTKTLLPYLN